MFSPLKKEHPLLTQLQSEQGRSRWQELDAGLRLVGGVESANARDYFSTILGQAQTDPIAMAWIASFASARDTEATRAQLSRQLLMVLRLPEHQPLLNSALPLFGMHEARELRIAGRYDAVTNLLSVLHGLGQWSDFSLDLHNFERTPFRSRHGYALPNGRSSLVQVGMEQLDLARADGRPSDHQFTVAGDRSRQIAFSWFQDTPYAWTVSLTPHYPASFLERTCIEYLDSATLDQSVISRFRSRLEAMPQGLVGFIPTPGNLALIRQIQGISLHAEGWGPRAMEQAPQLSAYFALHPLLLTCALYAAKQSGLAGVLMDSQFQNRWIRLGKTFDAIRARQILFGSAALVRGPAGERFEEVTADVQLRERNALLGLRLGDYFLKFR